MLDEAALHSHLKELAATRPIFHSEADFQHSLAMLLAKKNNEVRLEYCVGDQPNDRKYIDIWLPNEKVAIELKYCTKKLNCLVGKEQYFLKDQSAHDIRRYDFCKDITRVEEFVENGIAKTGYAIFLTNDPSYWKDNTQRYKDKKAEFRPQDYNFRIHENAQLSSTLEWNGKPSKGTMGGRGPLNLENIYSFKWNEFKKLETDNDKASALRYTLQSVYARNS